MPPPAVDGQKRDRVESPEPPRRGGKKKVNFALSPPSSPRGHPDDTGDEAADGSAPAEAEAAKLRRANRDLIRQMKWASINQRSVHSKIKPDDLTMTTQDRQAGREHFRDCPIFRPDEATNPAAAVGAHGSVYRAVWKSGGIDVALKEHRRSSGQITAEMDFFLDLHHPHVVACYGILEEDVDDGGKRYSIVTERCQTSLHAFLEDHKKWESPIGQPLSPLELDMRKYTILLHVAQGLEKLHDMGVLHRDIKGGNILLNGEAGHCASCGVGGNWKICDFGESKVLKTPTLQFQPPRNCPAGLRRILLENGRLQDVTSEVLQEKGCYQYCWLQPRELSEERWVEGKPKKKKPRQEPTSNAASPLPFLPTCGSQGYKDQYGGLAFFFGHSATGDGNDLDRVFLIDDLVDEPTPLTSSDASSSSGGGSGGGQLDDPQFPEVIGPANGFRLTPTTELNVSPNRLMRTGSTPSSRKDRARLSLDLKCNKYCLDLSPSGGTPTPQLNALRDLYGGKLALEGCTSAPCPLDPPHATSSYSTDDDNAMSSDQLRRRMMLPARDGATHFVWAYQQAKWNARKLSSTQLGLFEKDSGEISLASRGGYIYFKATEWDRQYPPQPIAGEVVCVNALSVGPPRPCLTGTINRANCGQGLCRGDRCEVCDKKVTPHTASPELIKGKAVGLETDIYAMGIVMWEVFTRCKAWHWIRHLDPDGIGFCIQNQVGTLGRRPKVPAGLSPACAKMIRRCLHTDPSRRPTAIELREWLSFCRIDLQQSIREQKADPVSERSMYKAKFKAPNWNHWSAQGRYTLHTSVHDPDKSTFAVSITSESASDWVEMALIGDEDEPHILEQTVSERGNRPHHDETAKLPPLGIGFESEDSKAKTNQYPSVVKLCKFNPCICQIPGATGHHCRPRRDMLSTATIAGQFPDIRRGCKLLEINGKPAPETFKEFKRALGFTTSSSGSGSRTLTLVFSDSVVRPSKHKGPARFLPTILPELNGVDISDPASLARAFPTASAGSKAAGEQSGEAIAAPHAEEHASPKAGTPTLTGEERRKKGGTAALVAALEVINIVRDYEVSENEKTRRRDEQVRKLEEEKEKWRTLYLQAVSKQEAASTVASVRLHESRSTAQTRLAD